MEDEEGEEDDGSDPRDHEQHPNEISQCLWGGGDEVDGADDFDQPDHELHDWALPE